MKILKDIFGKIGLIGVLIVVLPILKIANLINWSWIAVLAPIWLTFLIMLLVAILLTAKKNMAE